MQLGLVGFAPSLFSACDNEVPKNGKKVVVVGAGISGLAAATQLKNNGFEVIILEAQDRVGGRLRSNRSLGIAFDEGASWIHGIQGNPITTLAEKAGMKTFHTNDDSRKVYDVGGKAYPTSTLDDVEDAFYSMLEVLMNKGNPSKSFEEVFTSQYPDKINNRLWKFFLSTYLTFDTGDLDKLSSQLYDEGEEFGGIEVISTNGYDTIPMYLAKALNVQLNQVVTAIDYTNSAVKITHNGQITEADYVLVSVPLGVLKNKKIQFLPALPTEKLTAIDKVGMNCVNKFLLTWETAFWDDVQYISYTPEKRDKFNYFVNVKKFHPNVNALMTFAYAEYGRETEKMSDAEVVQEIMTHLRDLYGMGIPNPTNLLRTKWDSNPYSFGAYSFTAVGTEMAHFESLAEAVAGRVFFAGEHTEVDYFSTAHGAYRSGLREADKIEKA